MADVRALVIEDGKVINAVNASPEFATAQGWRFGAGTDHVDIGWVYRNGAFWPPEPAVLMPDGAAIVDIAAFRQATLDEAMAYGNSITAGELSKWAGVEPLTWPLQREEARRVLQGQTLDEFALLPGLAADAGKSQVDYARSVLGNAARYQAVARAAVKIRRAAETILLDESLDTPEKVREARDVLQEEVDSIAASLLTGEVPMPALSTDGFIHIELLRQRAKKRGIFDALADFLGQTPDLSLDLTTAPGGLIDPAHPALIAGLAEAQVSDEDRAYLLQPPEEGAP